APGENAPGENAPGENAPGENAPGENTPGENHPGENTPGENHPGENTPGENHPGENHPGENHPGENGVDLDDILVSVNLSPTILANGTILFDVSLDGTALTGRRGNKTYSGADFVGAKMVGTTGVGQLVEVNVGTHGFGAPPNADLDTYFVTWNKHGHHHSPEQMCLDESGNPLPAMPVYGYWDYTQGTRTGGDKTESTTKITFACPDGAIGKCINWGYRPWTSYNGVNLSPYHQACTRMTRADYCGDGTPHTVVGAWINLYDNLGLNIDDAHWVMEAQWSPHGATCLSPGGITDGGSAVACYNQLASPSCGADDPNAMLTTETPTGARMTFPSMPPL
ncbi:MAG: hypothetical protein JST54_25705, partial [Deltaproteobacteria bacterium]|nr:hypothetical protein [Deltaproteobacteria bacterium]